MTITTSRLSVATIALFLVSGAAGSATAQAPKQAPPKAHAHQHGQQGMSCPHDGMGGPHHAMSMGYWGSLAAFARTLQEEVAQSKTVDLEVARPAVQEMRRSFDAIRQHHQAHMATMIAADSTRARKMDHMDSAMASIGEHLAALEAEVNAPKPDPGKVTEHTTAILKHCGADAPAKAHPNHH